jgi:hypothetical protein
MRFDTIESLKDHMENERKEAVARLEGIDDG